MCSVIYVQLIINNINNIDEETESRFKESDTSHSDRCACLHFPLKCTRKHVTADIITKFQATTRTNQCNNNHKQKKTIKNHQKIPPNIPSIDKNSIRRLQVDIPKNVSSIYVNCYD